MFFAPKFLNNQIHVFHYMLKLPMAQKWFLSILQPHLFLDVVCNMNHLASL